MSKTLIFIRLSVLLALVSGPISAASAASNYTGIWAESDDKHYLWVGQNWDGFEKKWKELNKKNLRLVDLETYVVGGERRYAGVWLEGKGKHYLWVGKDWKAFEKKWKELSKKKLRLIDIEIYAENGKNRYAGVWEEGNDSHYLWVRKSWKDFEKKWKSLNRKKLRLVDLEVHRYKGKNYYSGVWRRGTDKHYLWAGKSWSDFREKWSELSEKNLRLVDIEINEVDGKKYYSGVFRAGKERHALWNNVDWENFSTKHWALKQKDLRLVDLEIQSGCDSVCVNKVSGGRSYNRRVDATDMHCNDRPGTCAAPADGDTVGYQRPIIVEGDKEYLRLAPMYFKGRPFTLPFKDKSVGFGASWIYGGGSHHYAVDYSIDGRKTFKVVSTAPGRVIYVGWQWNSGNTVVVSHDVDGRKDAFRTVYMHLRDGPANDCRNSWNVSVARMRDGGDSRLSNFSDYLEDSGCPETGRRRPDSDDWGRNSHDIEVTVGEKVSRGETIGWAGNTGPGGRGDTDQIKHPNHHLHIKFAVRDNSDGLWYLVDPYGIYAGPDCYPEDVEGKLSGLCVRYPVAWRDGRPERP